MRLGSPSRALGAAALAAAIAASLAAACGRPPDEAWLRFLGFRSSGAADASAFITGNLTDGATDTADAVFQNASTGLTKDGPGTAVTVTRAHVVYKIRGLSPPSYDYALTLYVPPASGSGETASGGQVTLKDFPVVPVTLKKWIIDSHAYSGPESAPAIGMTAEASFYGTTDEGVAVDTKGSVSIKLEKDEDSTLSVGATDPLAKEGGADNGEFTISRSGSDAATLTVGYTLSGTAANGTDYQRLDGSVVIPGGSDSATVAIVALTDSNGAEGDETVVLTLQPGDSYTLGALKSATVVIKDAP